MAKKKILLSFTGPMEIGGIERSLLSLLDAIDYDCYDVDLFLYGHHGPWFDLINPRARLLPQVRELAYLRESIGAKLRHGCFYSAALRVRDGLRALLGRRVDVDLTWGEVARRCVKPLETRYDLALGFFLPFTVLSEKVSAARKVGWVHTDYTSERGSIPALTREYDTVDYIAAVSDQCRASFLSIFPQYEEKTIVVENLLSPEMVRRLASEPLPPDFPRTGRNCGGSDIVLLTVGRFAPCKRTDEIPLLCRLLREAGLPVKWCLIGYGDGESELRTNIEREGMEGQVLLLGRKENPYPYMKACDVYVQPSRYEGKAVVVREAQILARPVLITAYPTAASQLEDGVDGAILPMDTGALAAAMAKALRDPARLSALAENCRSRDYSGKAELEKIYALAE